MKVLSPEVVLNKRVLVRLDLDVPFNEKGELTDTTRIDAAIPTLELLKEKAKQIIICGHMGRPKGKLDPNESLSKLVPFLEDRLATKVAFDDHYIAQEKPQELTSKFTLLENLRFFGGEEENDPVFVGKLASTADIFVFEAFGVAHREAASTVGITKKLASFAGLHVAKEVIELSTVLHSPIKPTVLVLGGAKIETKLPVIFHLEDIADAILIGGLLAKEVKEQNLTLPENCVVGNLREDGLDIDDESIDRFTNILSKAQTVVWNGPVGKFEDPSAAKGTQKVAAAAIGSEGYTIVGGGDTVAALHAFNVLDQFDFISVGGGAMLTFLAGQPLPALHALE